MRVTFRKPTADDIAELGRTMRAMDRMECELIAGADPATALAECVENSAEATAALIAGEVVCIFGYTEASFLGSDAYPWMLCAEGVEKHWRAMLACTPRFLGEMQARCEHLANVVHADNRSAIRFLSWCGFTFGEVFHVKGEPFLRFEWRREAEAHEGCRAIDRDLLLLAEGG